MVVAGGYGAVVVGVTVWVESLVVFGDAGFAGVWLILVTLPASIPLSRVPVPPVAWGVIMAAGGLSQAWVRWRLLRGKRLRDQGVRGRTS